MEFQIGQKIKLPKDYRITLIGMKTLKYTLVNWVVKEFSKERIVLTFKNKIWDCPKANIELKLEFLNSKNE